MVTETKKTEKTGSLDPVDVPDGETPTGHFRIIGLGDKSDILVQHETDDAAQSQLAEAPPWHSARSK